MFRDEDKIIRILQKYIHSSSIGDDVAYLKKIKNCIITTDQLIENTHFSWKYFTPKNLANKLFHVNLSDILVKNGTPKYALLNLTLNPKKKIFSKIKDFSIALGERFKEHGITLIGGDTTQGSLEMFSLTLLGTTKKIIPRKSNKIKQKDLLICLGNIGMSQWTFEQLRKKKLPQNTTHLFHTEPKCNAEHIKKFISLKPIVAMDQSDSVYETIEILANDNFLRLNVFVDKIPLHSCLDEVLPQKKIKYSLTSAEDLSWFFITSSKQIIKPPFYVIGEVLDILDKKSIVNYYNKNKKINEKSFVKNIYTHF